MPFRICPTSCVRSMGLSPVWRPEFDLHRGGKRDEPTNSCSSDDIYAPRPHMVVVHSRRPVLTGGPFRLYRSAPRTRFTVTTYASNEGISALSPDLLLSLICQFSPEKC
ncbi:hypothetical protein PHMEG_00023824 [Phytophthora megakarya]|uniref:Uncharacterized protein n=1 Tax=Phytophthora megakarya TaxID=4795 RepID=A0A225VF67_9STRA|nr:hypothetical protein PHMEG_00023824 [Phytophthora megakarya]